MSDGDLAKQFAEYRDAAMKSTASRLDHPTFLDEEQTQLRELLMAEWPEAAPHLHSPALTFRQIGHGHQSGALCELSYDVGSDELGWRRFDLRWVNDDAGWVWEAAP